MCEFMEGWLYDCYLSEWLPGFSGSEKYFISLHTFILFLTIFCNPFHKILTDTYVQYIVIESAPQAYHKIKFLIRYINNRVIYFLFHCPPYFLCFLPLQLFGFCDSLDMLFAIFPQVKKIIFNKALIIFLAFMLRFNFVNIFSQLQRSVHSVSAFLTSYLSNTFISIFVSSSLSSSPLINKLILWKFC